MKLPIYLYPNVVQVILDLDYNNRIYQVMYQRELKLQKGLKNTIQLQFKNSDQKFLNISTGSFVCQLFDSTDNRDLVCKPVIVLDDGVTLALRGLGEVVFTPSDLEQCQSTFYQFVVKAVDPTDGTFVPTYANTYYGIAGTVEVRHDILPTLIPSQEVDASAFQQFYDADYGVQKYEYYSGNLFAYPQYKSNEALQTIAIYMTNYSGQVLIEGTLENTPSTFANYATIVTNNYSGFTGIDYVNFVGIFSYVRVRYIPATNPVTQTNELYNNPFSAQNIAYAGTVDKILYRG